MDLKDFAKSMTVKFNWVKILLVTYGRRKNLKVLYPHPKADHGCLNYGFTNKITWTGSYFLVAQIPSWPK